uniref:Uncharacterized protein n=1 Tax=Rhizophora mucronata TaxID=61149 RepID=A0A2P2KZR1_RHIMU
MQKLHFLDNFDFDFALLAMSHIEEFHFVGVLLAMDL